MIMGFILKPVIPLYFNVIYGMIVIEDGQSIFILQVLELLETLRLLTTHLMTSLQQIRSITLQRQTLS
jgi:hypothetical protein